MTIYFRRAILTSPFIHVGRSAKYVYSSGRETIASAVHSKQAFFMNPSFAEVQPNFQHWLVTGKVLRHTCAMTSALSSAEGSDILPGASEEKFRLEAGDKSNDSTEALKQSEYRGFWLFRWGTDCAEVNEPENVVQKKF